jgi:hypothetical protein
VATPDATVAQRSAARPRRVISHWDETKPSFMTTEFYVLLAGVVGILIAVAQADNFDAPRAWTLIAAVAIGYMVSRGLAKSGSAHRDRDQNEDGVV